MVVKYFGKALALHAYPIVIAKREARSLAILPTSLIGRPSPGDEIATLRWQ